MKNWNYFYYLRCGLPLVLRIKLSSNMLANSALLLESDPFEFLLKQKTARNKPKHQKTIKLNLNRLPPDFFPMQRIRRLQSHSERPQHENQFLFCHQTLDLRSQRKVSSHTKELKRINPFSVKRESVCSSRRVQSQREHATQPREDAFEGFNCTFARKLNSECMQLKKVQFPILDTSRKGKIRGRLMTLPVN